MSEIRALLFKAFTTPTPEMVASRAAADAEIQRGADALDAKLQTLSLQLIWALPIEALPRC
jgi:hypothetical protein